MSTTANSAAKFTLGETIITSGVMAFLPNLDIALALQRHQSGDWGELDADDRKTNDDRLLNGGWLVSIYRTIRGQKFYIITESDRSFTTVLLPEEY